MREAGFEGLVDVLDYILHESVGFSLIADSKKGLHAPVLSKHSPSQTQWRESERTHQTSQSAISTTPPKAHISCTLHTYLCTIVQLDVRECHAEETASEMDDMRKEKARRG